MKRGERERQEFYRIIILFADPRPRGESRAIFIQTTNCVGFMKITRNFVYMYIMNVNVVR